MTDVARRAGVHASTVSRALRDDPRITPGQRTLVQRCAAEMGYRPNPLVAALMSARRSGREPAYRATLGFVTKYPPERAAWFAREFGLLLQSARERARTYGYRVEEFNCHGHDVSPARLSEILRHRAIHGVIVAPLHSIREQVTLDWSQLCTVAIGYSLHDVAASRVSHNHFTGLALAVQQCRAAGRQRLGLVLPRRVHEKVEKRWLAALLLEQGGRPAGERVPPLLFEHEDEKEFRSWFREHRPNALLCLNAPLLQDWLGRLGRAARGVALVSLDRRPRDRGIAGIDQDYPLLGATAVDALIGMLQRNERGLPPKPLTLLIDGTWVGGRSLAPLTAEPAPRSPRATTARAPA